MLQYKHLENVYSFPNHLFPGCIQRWVVTVSIPAKYDTDKRLRGLETATAPGIREQIFAKK